MIQRRLVVVNSLLFALLSVPLAAHGAEPFRFPEGKHKQAELKYISDLPVLSLQGTPEEMGEQAATLMADCVAPLMDVPKQILQRHHMDVGWAAVAALGEAMIGRIPADHRRELEAIIKTSGLDRSSLIVANSLLELRWLGGCSTLIVGPDRSKTKGLLFGRNFDFPTMGVLHTYSLVTVYRPKGKHTFVSIGFPGLVGVVSGMNDTGLALATLDVGSSKDGSTRFDPTGVPLTFCFRRVLEECATVDEAEKLLRAVKRTTWMNLAVCDKDQGAVLELTPRNVVVRRPVEHILPCTNHFRTAQLAASIECWRCGVLQQAWDREMLGLKDVAELMHAVNQDEMTIQTMVFEPASSRLHLAIGAGPVSTGPLRLLEVETLLEAGAGQ